MKPFAVSTLVFILSVPAGLATASEPDVYLWKPQGISSTKFESHPAFDPKNGDFYFVRSSPQFQGWRIFVSHCTETGWSEPQPPSFAGDGVEADPVFTADGNSLYFISSRSVNGVKRDNLDIFRVDRDAAGVWGAPVQLPEPINSAGAEWFPRLAPDGSLYFGSDRPGGLGATDIWRARRESDKWIVENLGPAVNTPGDEYEPLLSPDGWWMIVMADGDFYETRMTEKGWSPRTKVSENVIRPGGLKVGALFSPSGRTLMFARDTQGPDSGEFFVWQIDGEDAWPPECGRK